MELVSTFGKTVEKPRGRPGKTVARDFPRTQREGTFEGKVFQSFQRLFHRETDFLNPVGQSGAFETLKSLKLKHKGPSDSP